MIGSCHCCLAVEIEFPKTTSELRAQIRDSPVANESMAWNHEMECKVYHPQIEEEYLTLVTRVRVKAAASKGNEASCVTWKQMSLLGHALKENILILWMLGMRSVKRINDAMKTKYTKKKEDFATARTQGDKQRYEAWEEEIQKHQAEETTATADLACFASMKTDLNGMKPAQGEVKSEAGE